MGQLKVKAILCLLLVSLAIHSPTLAQDISGRVITVFSGDSIEIVNEHAWGQGPQRVRLFGIDAPEPEQPFSEDARMQLEDWCLNQVTRLTVVHTENDGVLVGRVYFEGEDINLKMIQFGLAWWHPEEAADLDEYSNAEQQARTEQQGLWQDQSPVAPWRFKPVTLPKVSIASTRGLAIGLNIGRTTWHTDIDELALQSSKGSNRGLEVVYGFSEVLAFHLGASLGKVEDGDLGIDNFDFGVTYFLYDGNVRPFLEAIVSWRTLRRDNLAGWITNQNEPFYQYAIDSNSSNYAIGGGGGIMYFVTPQLALELGILVSLGKHSYALTEYRTRDGATRKTQYSGTSSRGQLGIRWYPGV